MLAEKDERGQFKSVVYHPQYNLNLSEYFPARIRLIYRGGDGGFVRYQPRNANQAFHEMRQAPEGGYEKEIVVDLSHAFDKQVLSDDMKRYRNFWFYWRIGGKYGKGVAEFRTQKWPIPMVHMTLFSQADGSRNLEDPLAY